MPKIFYHDAFVGLLKYANLAGKLESFSNMTEMICLKS
jgi:hypothetical protein